MVVVLATLLALTGLSKAQSVWKCDSLIQPNWDDCEAVNAMMPWYALPGEHDAAAGKCTIWYREGHVGNCIISLCNTSDRPMPMNAFVQGDYFLVRESCRPTNSGGETSGPGYYITVTNDPDQVSSPSRVKRALGKQMESNTVTIEENEKLYEKAMQQTTDEGLASRSSELIAKRQGESWTNVGLYENVRKPGERSRMTPSTPSGVSQQWSTSDGYSTSVSVSVEVGASFFEVFSASVSTTVTAEQSVSYTKGYTFDPSGRCEPEQSAVLYFYPLFTRYEGFRNGDSANFVDVYVPLDEEVNFEMDVECLG